MPAKLERCVDDLENDSSVDNPWAVCNASIGEMGANWGGDEETPLTNQMAESMIQEMKATPMTGSTKRMSGGSKGKAPKHWTPVDFNVLDKAQGQDPVPVPVGRAVQEANLCEVCGVPNDSHQDQDHPMIPPMPQENNMPPMPNGQAPMEPPMITPPAQSNGMPPMPMPQPNPQEQEPFPQPNGMGMPQPNGMPPMPPAQIPPPIPNSPQEQMPPIPTQNQEPQMQQYTSSIPNSLSAQSIGGKKINEMIREIEPYLK